MKKGMRHSAALILVLALTMGGAVCPGKRADATVVWTEQIIDPHGGKAVQGQENWVECRLGASRHDVNFHFTTFVRVGLTYEIRDTVTKGIVKKETVPADSEKWQEYEVEDREEKAYVYEMSLGKEDIPEQGSGKCRITFFFDGDTDYTLSATQICDSGYPPLPKPRLNKSRLTLTKGFQEKLKVVQKHGDTIKWSSSAPSVASVNQKGVVKAKKTGTAVITIEQYNGETDSCTVKVRENVYKTKTPTVRSIEKGTSLMQVCHVWAVKKGALKVQVVFVNRTDHTAVRFGKLRIQMRNKKGKTVFVYQKKDLKLKVKPRRKKWFTFVIPKSKLKLKKTQDLRQSSVKLTRKVTFSLKK